MVETEVIAKNEIGYIKLYKNTKNYNWEIKLHEDKNTEQFKLLIDQLDKLNTEMLTKFGGIDYGN